MSEEYYLQDSREYVGNSILWWAKGCNGYVCDIRNAHVFTKEEALQRHSSRGTDIPWPKEYIDAKISNHIDRQHCQSSDLPEQVRSLHDQARIARNVAQPLEEEDPHASFIAHLESCREQVASWPEWKQEILGRKIASPTSSKDYINWQDLFTELDNWDIAENEDDPSPDSIFHSKAILKVLQASSFPAPDSALPVDNGLVFEWNQTATFLLEVDRYGVPGLIIRYNGSRIARIGPNKSGE
jgi:hypothetical protein